MSVICFRSSDDWEQAPRTAEGNGRPDVARALPTGRT